MSKEEKRFVKNATWALRGMLLLVFLLAAALCYVALQDNSADPVNQSNTEVQNEEAEDQTFDGVPTLAEYRTIPVSSTAQSHLAETSCLLVKVVDGEAPGNLNIDNTLRIPPRLCLSFMLGINAAINEGLLEPKDLLYNTL